MCKIWNYIINNYWYSLLVLFLLGISSMIYIHCYVIFCDIITINTLSFYFIVIMITTLCRDLWDSYWRSR